ncbi:MAG: ribonuclease HII [Elusimicrobia bacterium]|nr:ribonuclease HII [Elusimicrobiota bacterium]
MGMDLPPSRSYLQFDAALLRRLPAGGLAGVDEAGRGAWAGPVVAAAVVLDFQMAAGLSGLKDSKQLSPRARQALLPDILKASRTVALGWSSSEVVDACNVWEATRRAMRQAVRGLEHAPALALVDGPHAVADLGCPQQPVVDGDARSLSIAAASVVAKVVRDRWMFFWDRLLPGYGFARHKGYGTHFHRRALGRLGCCGIHRRSFSPIAAWGASR